MKFMSSILISTLLLSGCIDVAEDDEINNPATDNPPAADDNPTTNTSTLEGRVADGYLVDAKVCLDLNNNNACDDNEPSVMSLAGGLFSISDVTEEQLSNSAIIVEAIVGQTYDEDAPSLTIDQAFTLSAPIGQTFISPLTTIIKSNMDSGMSYSSALTQLITKTGLTIDPTVDYVAAKINSDLSAEERADYASAHEIAKIITGLIAARSTGNEALSLTEIAEEVDQQLAKIADAVETAEENNEDIVIDDIITDINDDIESLETIACDASNAACGIWLDHNFDEFGTYDYYSDITSLQGGIYEYYVESGECLRIPAFINNNQISNVTEDLDRAQVNQTYSKFISYPYNITGSTLFLNDPEIESEIYEYTRVDVLPDACTQLPSVDLITETVSVKNEIIGHWIGSEKPFNSSPQNDIAVILREDGTATYLDGFDADNLSCFDYEIEMLWALNDNGTVVLIDPDPVDGDISESFLFKTSGNSLIEKEGYDTAREWTPTSLTEQQLRDKCDSDPYNNVGSDPDADPVTTPDSEPESSFVAITNLYDVEGVTHFQGNYTALTASSATTGVFTQYYPGSDINGNACTNVITSNVSIIEVPITSDTTTSGVYGQDTLNAYDPFIILLLLDGYTDTHLNTVTVSLEGVVTSTTSSDRLDSLPSLPAVCN